MDRNKALEQLALRLSRLGDGVDKELDVVLDRIRDEIRDGANPAKLEDLSGRLARGLMLISGVDVDRRGSANEGYDLSGLQKLIKSMPVKGDEQNHMGQLVQRIASGQSTMARQKALVELLGASAEALREVATREKSESGVRGWLGKKSGGEGSERYVALFVQLLQRLVEHIDVLNGNAARSMAIKDALDHVVHPDQAQHILEEVTEEIEAIDSRIRAERDQTTDFLGALRDRLDGFGEVLGLVGVDSDNTLQRAKDLETTLSADARSLDEATQVATIEEMRELIQSGLTHIAAHVEEHVIAEREQNEKSKERINELNERLAALESESEVLRSEIRTKNDLALKDSLTGVYNRAGYEERAVELFARWERSGAALSLVFVDCNKFKEINDNFGHAAGDLVLVKVAETLQERSRASDIVCRFGGDEFVVLLPDTDAAGGEAFARSACQEILDVGFNDNGRPLDVSISCGVTQLVEGDTQEKAVARADEAMYAAKKMEGIQVSVVI